MKLFYFLMLCMASSKLNLNTTNNKEGRVFSLFSIVQFPNEACTSTSGTYGNGTCYTAGECSSKGGSAQGNCAAGFGVCCTFTVSATGSSVRENCTYIVNPSYPRQANFATMIIINQQMFKQSCHGQHHQLQDQQKLK